MAEVRNRPRPRRNGPARYLPALVLLCAASPGHAASRLAITAQSLAGSGVVARQVGITVAPSGPSALAVALRAARLDGLGTPVADLRFECPQLVAADTGIACRAGRLSGNFGVAGRQDTPLRLSLAADGRQQVALPALALAGGAVSLEVELHGERWRASGEFSAVDLGRLAGLQPLAARLPAGTSAAGQASGSLQASGSGSDPARLQVRVAVSALSFANGAGTLAGEGLGFEADVRLARTPPAAGWSVGAQLTASAGQAYLDPVFVDVAARPVELQFSGRLAGDASALAVEQFRVRQQGVGLAEGTAELDLTGGTPLRSARLGLRDVDLAGAWSTYGSPFLVTTHFSDLEAAGRISGEVEVEGGLPKRVQLDLDGVIMDSVTGALGVQGLTGHLSWFDERTRNELGPRVDSAIFKSRLGWDAARLWGIELGPASIPFTATGDSFRLLDPVLLPVFDGGLAIETLRLRHPGTPQMYLRFDAQLRPVSIALITRALGWPEFAGTLSGRIPRLELEEGLVTLGGNIEAEVFDGKVTVRNLRMRDPLGRYPQLFADIDVEGLELEQLTRTFEFGAITGRLSGRVAALETFGWKPVAFDARFYTTPGDRSPHRISQRAVSNLSSIGGGSGGTVTAALQGGFLRFFDTFGYDRLGLSCRLANDICAMDGVARAGSGYYIVKGSGLPRIDVIGSQRRVAWTRLVRQLTAIAQSQGPVVQ